MSTPEPPPPPGDSPSESSGPPSYGSVPPPPDVPGGPGGSVPPPPPPPAPPSPSAQGFSAAEAIAWGWRKFTENVGAVILAVLATLGISILVGVLTGLMSGTLSSPMPANPLDAMKLASASPLELVGRLIEAAVNTVLGGVAAKAALEVADGQRFDFFGAFGKVNVIRLVVAGIVIGIAIGIGFELLVIPGLIVAFLTFLTSYSLVDDDKSVVDAIKHSVKLVSSNIGGALLLLILSLLVVIAGAVALCVGLIVALPITVFATAYAYRSFNGQPIAS
jgi:uncharacterized membrane protein